MLVQVATQVQARLWQPLATKPCSKDAKRKIVRLSRDSASKNSAVALAAGGNLHQEKYELRKSYSRDRLCKKSTSSHTNPVDS